MAGCQSAVHLQTSLMAGKGDWNQLGGGPGRLGLAGTALVPPLRPAWTASLTDIPLAVSPVAAGGTVICASARGTVDVFDLRTGAPRGGLARAGTVKSTPAVLDGMLCLGFAQPNLQAWLVDIAERRECSTLAAGWIEASVLACDSRVVCASIDGHLRSFPVAGAGRAWDAELPTRLLAAPSQSGALVIVAGANGDVWAVDSSVGTVRWRHPTGAAVTAAPVCAQGFVVTANRSGVVTCLDAADGAQRWRADMGAPVYCATATDGTTVYAAASNGAVAAFNLTDGRELWRRTTGALVNLAPVVTGANLVVCTMSGEILLFARADGAQLWKQVLEQRIICGPIVQDGMLVVCTDDGDIHAFTGPGR